MNLLVVFLVCELVIIAQPSQDFNSPCPYLNCAYGTMPNNPCQCLMPNQLNQGGYAGNNPCATMSCGYGQRCAVTQVGPTCISVSVNSGPVGNIGNAAWGGIPQGPYAGGYMRRPVNPFNRMMYRRPSNYGPNIVPGMNQPYPGQMPNNINMMPGNMMGNQMPGPFQVPLACTQTMEVGGCSGRYSRFYFNRLSGRCETFRYSGCGGNNNNFATFSQCQQLCATPPSFRLGR